MEFRLQVEDEGNEIVPMLYTGDGDVDFEIPETGVDPKLQNYVEGLVKLTELRIKNIQSGDVPLSKTEAKKNVDSYNKGIEIVNTKKA